MNELKYSQSDFIIILNSQLSSILHINFLLFNDFLLLTLVLIVQLNIFLSKKQCAFDIKRKFSCSFNKHFDSVKDLENYKLSLFELFFNLRDLSDLLKYVNVF